MPTTSTASAENFDAANSSVVDVEDIPQSYICPLTLEIMDDPLMDRRGMNFERKAILEWLHRGNSTCPLTREPLSYSKLIPNAQLRFQIDQWKTLKGIKLPERETFPQMDYMMIEPTKDTILEFRGNNQNQTLSAWYADYERRRDRRAVVAQRDAATASESPASRRRRLGRIIGSALSVVRRGSLTSS